MQEEDDDSGGLLLSYRVPLTERHWSRPDRLPMTREHMLMALSDLQFVLVRANVVAGATVVG